MESGDDRNGLFQLLNWLFLNNPERVLPLFREHEAEIWMDDWGITNGSATLIDMGDRIDRVDLIQEGVDHLASVVSDDHSVPDALLSTALYNAGNAYQLLAQKAPSTGTARDPDNEYFQLAKTMYRRAITLDAAIPAREVAALYTNYGNVLAACGRHYDALVLYDQAIHIDPTYSMATGNKGIELLTYASLSGSHPGSLRAEAFDLCNKAADDSHLDASGQSAARVAFAHFRDLLALGVEHYRSHLKEEFTAKSSVRRRAKRDQELHHFFSTNGLYLNLCVHEWPCSEQDVDSLFFDYVTSLTESARFHKLARYFNQIKEDYATARYLLANAALDDVPRDRVSAWTQYADLLEYADYGLRGGIAKTALSTAYNILDKIGVFVMLELRIRESESSIFFSRMWRNTNSTTLRPEIRRTNDWNLFALYDLARDLTTPPLSQIVDLRRAITHRHLVSHDMFMFVGEGSEPHDHIMFDDLVEEGITVLQTVKSAIVYLAAYLNQEHLRRVEGREDQYMPMPVVWQHDMR